MKTRHFILATLTAATVLGTAFAVHGVPASPHRKPAPVARPALTVSTETPVAAQLPVRMSANGTVAAWQEASIGAEVQGLRLAEVLVNVGDRVRRGQVIARFDRETT